MEQYKKFLAKLSPTLRARLIKAVCQIAVGNLKNLDIKMMHSKYSVYRCRVGKLRILFQKTENGNSIMDIGFRGDIYKNF
jgi:mRNA-degrading endonuclease RelE of RelBE toxin-antitoxin system